MSTTNPIQTSNALVNLSNQLTERKHLSNSKSLESAAANSDSTREVEQMQALPSKKSGLERLSAGLPDTNLRFDVDRNTGEVTVFVVNTVTKEVVRTIPPDELEKLGYNRTLELYR